MKQLAASPRPVRSFSAEKGRISLEFEPPAQQAPKEIEASARRVDTVPGTNFPADKTPLNPLDTVLHVPKYDANEADA